MILINIFLWIVITGMAISLALCFIGLSFIVIDVISKKIDEKLSKGKYDE